ncbi:hypothetical protein EMCRGX_G010967 [Ephydatia muelleri]
MLEVKPLKYQLSSQLNSTRRCMQEQTIRLESERKSSKDELTSLQMEKTAARDKEKVELLSFPTELVATIKQLLAEMSFP